MRISSSFFKFPPGRPTDAEAHTLSDWVQLGRQTLWTTRRLRNATCQWSASASVPPVEPQADAARRQTAPDLKPGPSRRD